MLGGFYVIILQVQIGLKFNYVLNITQPSIFFSDLAEITFNTKKFLNKNEI